MDIDIKFVAETEEMFSYEKVHILETGKYIGYIIEDRPEVDDVFNWHFVKDCGKFGIVDIKAKSRTRILTRLRAISLN